MTEYLSGESSDWQKTTLWELLMEKDSKDTPEVESVRTFLNRCMPEIQKVLSQGGTASPDFTLHDSGHAFRVARRMAEIIPSDVLPKLSAYELAMLLLSAYLHDIGMTPERRKVSLHYAYLITGDPQDLSKDEIKEFQKWLDNEGSGIVPPLTQERTTLETSRLAEELVKYYCRHRHNDWSEEWIKKNLSNHELGTYVDWVDDLVSLCCSHHYGYNELAKDKFDPRPVGSTATVIHLRYLACVLRIADVLEFDPERTPDVILRHRDISPDSLIYWWKDKYISMVQEGNRLVLSARPPKAYIHRAIEITADQVDDELRLCRTLADETHFETCPGLNDPLPHRWDLLPSMHRTITAKDDTYEYIDGAFRPDTNKLLELLSGVELYGNHLAAVRELLQNAFDAVREQIAYERLGKPDPKDSELRDMLGKLHQVDLRLETSPDGTWLICSDNGVGMTKAIIRDYLLVSGTARRHDLLDLERRCKDAGFSLGRTGQFGIGVLSYFMIANKVVIRTRRSQETGDAETTGWHFETEGIGSFGELQRDTTLRRGTEVRLRLRHNIVGADPINWYRELRNYLNGMMTRTPCKFQLSSPLPECENLSLNAGWAKNSSDFFEGWLSRFGKDYWEDESRNLELALLSNTRRQELEARNRYWEELKEELRQYVRWELQEGDLPSGLGRFRIHLPYFALPDGASIAFLQIQKKGSELSLKEFDNFYRPQTEFFMSWKGMEVKRPRDISWFLDMGICFLEVDWDSAVAGGISVNRGEIALSNDAEKTLLWLNQQVNDIKQTFLKKNRDSAYALLNNRLLGGEAILDKQLNWLFVEQTGKEPKAYWKPLPFPCINRAYWPLNNFLWKNKSVFVIPSMRTRRGRYEDSPINWNSPRISPDRIMAIDYNFDIRPVAFWSQRPKEKKKHIVGLTCRFPTKWSNVIGVRLSSYSEGYGNKTDIWNANHSILRSIDPSGWEWVQNSFSQNLDPLPLKVEILKHKSRAASWLIYCLINSKEDLWNGLKDRDPSFLDELWTLVFKSGSRSGMKPTVPLCQWEENEALYVLTPEKWSSYAWRSAEYINHRKKHVPDPGLDWTLKMIKGNLRSGTKNKK